jgi:hypothetical protein
MSPPFRAHESRGNQEGHSGVSKVEEEDDIWNFHSLRRQGSPVERCIPFMLIAEGCGDNAGGTENNQTLQFWA